MTNIFPFTRATWITLLLAHCTLPLMAQNLVNNGDFSNGSMVSGWAFTTDGSFDFSSLDASGDAGSGSGQLTNTATVAFGTSFASQCINGIVAGNSYDFGARIRFDSGNTQTASGRASLVVNFYTGPNCSGSNVGSSTTSNVLSTSTDTWIQVEILGFAAPTGAVSVQVSLFTNKTEDSGSLTVNFDDVVFGPMGSLPVELSQIWIE